MAIKFRLLLKEVMSHEAEEILTTVKIIYEKFGQYYIMCDPIDPKEEQNSDAIFGYIYLRYCL